MFRFVPVQKSDYFLFRSAATATDCKQRTGVYTSASSVLPLVAQSAFLQAESDSFVPDYLAGILIALVINYHSEIALSDRRLSCLGA